ncbi:hypothetical protein E4U22_002361, partial [Claviceps purpurea]
MPPSLGNFFLKRSLQGKCFSFRLGQHPDPCPKSTLGPACDIPEHFALNSNAEVGAKDIFEPQTSKYLRSMYKWMGADAKDTSRDLERAK